MKKIKSVFTIITCFVLILSMVGCTFTNGRDITETPADVPASPEPVIEEEASPDVTPASFSFASSYDEIKSVLSGEADIVYSGHPDGTELFGEVSVISPDMTYRLNNAAYSGGFVYTLRNGDLIICGESDTGFEIISETPLFSESSSEGEDSENYTYSTESPRGIYIAGNTAVILTSSYTYAETFDDDSGSVKYSEKQQANVIFINVSDPASPIIVKKLSQDGTYCGAYVNGDSVFVVTSLFANDLSSPASFVPAVYEGSEPRLISPDDIAVLHTNTGSAYTVTAGYSVSSASTVWAKAVLGGLGRLYIADTAAYMVFSSVNNEYGENFSMSDIIKIDLAPESEINGVSVIGYPPVNFSFGEKDGSFYIGTVGEQNVIYSISPDLSDCFGVCTLPGEEILSLKFMGSTPYAETANGTVKIESDGSWEIMTPIPLPDRLYELSGSVYVGTVTDDGGGTILSAIDSYTLTEAAAVQLVSNEGEFFSGVNNIAVCPENGMAAVIVGSAYQIFRLTSDGLSLCASVPVTGRPSDFGFIFDGTKACAVSDTVTVIDLKDMSVTHSLQLASQEEG